jgi:hypothetical protein
MKRLVTTALLVLATSVGLLITTGSASAQSCNTVGASSAFAFSYGSFLASGRTSVSVVVSQKHSWSIREDVPAGLTISAQREDGTPLAQRTVTANELFDELDTWAVTLQNIPPNGAIRIATSWAEVGDVAVPGCFTDAATLPRRPGNFIRIGKWASPNRNLTIKAGSGAIPETCNSLAMGSVTLQATTQNGPRRANRTISLSDQCALLQDHSKSLPGGTLTLGPAGAALEIEGSWKEFRYFDLKVRDASLKSQLATVSAFYQPEYRVWQTTDEYWNYCIKKGIDTRMDQGYLYCLHPSFIRWWFGKKALNPAGDTIVDA